MKKWTPFIVCGFLVLLSVGSSPQRLLEGTPTAELKPVVDGSLAFALELYSQLTNADGNVFLSPYSVSSALAVAYGGAKGNTEEQMATTMHFLRDQDQLHLAMSKIRQTFIDIDRKKKIELNVANGLWPQQDYKFRKTFLDLAKKRHGSVVDFVDFRTAYGPAREEINAWVEHQTKQKIKNALPPDMLSSLTRLVIVNAIYFKGDWASRFDKKDTTQGSFWISSSKSIKAPMMRQEHVFRYAERDSLQLLELPYIGYDLSMLIFLPRERDGLPGLEKQLSPENLAKWINALGVWAVDVRFPKFATDSRFSLKKTLVAMGMSDAFSNRADFTGMTPKRPLCIDAVQHAAFVEVDEQGTVAAAATSISFGACGGRVSPPSATFHADHPFIFLIRDNHTGTILFLGKIVDPTI